MTKFCQKVLRKAKNDDDDDPKSRTNIKKRYNVDTCPGCLKQHFLPKYEKGFHAGLNAMSPKSGIFHYRNSYCPYPVPENMILTDKHLRHIELCGTELLERADDSPTLIRPPSKKYFIFSKHEARVDHRYTGYFDLETFNTELYPCCMECSELMQATRDKSKREVRHELVLMFFLVIFFLGYL